MDRLYYQIKDEVRIKILAKNYKMLEGTEKLEMEEVWGIAIETKRKRVEKVAWSKPPSGVLKLNTDGSVRNEEGY